MPGPTTSPPPPPAPTPPHHTATDLKADGCASLYTASLACLERAGYDKEACTGAFEAYKACRATEVMGQRGRGGWRDPPSRQTSLSPHCSFLSPLLSSLSHNHSTPPSGRPA